MVFESFLIDVSWRRESNPFTMYQDRMEVIKILVGCEQSCVQDLSRCRNPEIVVAHFPPFTQTPIVESDIRLDKSGIFQRHHVAADKEIGDSLPFVRSPSELLGKRTDFAHDHNTQIGRRVAGRKRIVCSDPLIKRILSRRMNKNIGVRQNGTGLDDVQLNLSNAALTSSSVSSPRTDPTNSAQALRASSLALCFFQY